MGLKKRLRKSKMLRCRDRDIKNILRDIGASLAFQAGCYVTDVLDHSDIEKFIDDGLMWKQDTSKELASLDRLVVCLKDIGIDL